MDYAKVLPHLFAACSMIETQLKKLDEVEEKLLFADLEEVNGIKSAHKSLTQTANHLQLSIAKNNVIESIRLLSIFYGLLYIIRPSITRLIEQYTNSLPCAILAKAISQDQVTLH